MQNQNLAVVENPTIVPSQQRTLSPADIAQDALLIAEVMERVMRNDEHYGTIPGTQKPTLLQPGAQKLMLVFRLSPDLTVETTHLENGHREYTVTCDLIHTPTGEKRGSGIGMATTMESKYRYRGSDFTVLDEPIPDDAKSRKAEYRKQGLGMKQVDGVWRWVKFGADRLENPDIADVYNTVLKMAVKRAIVAAVLNATAASDMFTQDMEDLRDLETGKASPEQLDAIADLRVKAGIDHELFAKQLKFFKVRTASELSVDQAATLIGRYEARIAEQTTPTESAE